VIESYLAEKNALYNGSSSAACPSACPRYGCGGDLVVTASLLEIFSQARFLGMEKAVLFGQAFRIGAAVISGLADVRIRFVLNKPCQFLDRRGACTIYPVRPAVCALFPEYLSLHPLEERKTLIESHGIGHFPCVEKAAFDLPLKRVGELRELRRIHSVEILADNIFLFGSGSFSIDLREEYGFLCTTDSPRISPSSIDEALRLSLHRRGLDRQIEEKLVSFCSDEGFSNYLSALSIAEELIAGSGPGKTGPGGDCGHPRIVAASFFDRGDPEMDREEMA
jgi:Fe-S-cluster containining protein